jgi:AcrR family transcriptional regulator
VPRIWSDTIEEHRDAVRKALLDAAGELVVELGLTGISMAAVAERAGIARATLYKYFPHIEALLEAWHAAHVAAHLAALEEEREKHAAPIDQLTAMLEAYARIVNESARHGAGAAGASLHRGDHVAQARRQLKRMFQDVIGRGIKARVVRSDIPADELAGFALAALEAARGLSRPGVSRLIDLTRAALRPPR